MKTLMKKLAAATALALPLAGAPLDAQAQNSGPAPACSNQVSLLDAWECVEEATFAISHNQDTIDRAMHRARTVFNQTRFTPADSQAIHQFLTQKQQAITASCAFARESVTLFFEQYNSLSTPPAELARTPVPPQMQAHADNFLRAAFHCHTDLVDTLAYITRATGGNPDPVTTPLRRDIGHYMR